MSAVLRGLRVTAIGFGLGSVAAVASLTPAFAQSKFVFANASPYDTLDPHMILDVGRVASRVNMYDGLLRWVDNPAKLEPWLAESYTVSPDGKTYTFKLRKGAKFHDGTEIKAADVVYSMERILALKGQCVPAVLGPRRAGLHQGDRTTTRSSST